MEGSKLLDDVIAVVRQASAAVMEIYNSGDFNVETKADNSPVTYADKTANQIIEDGLKKISNFPIISEEGGHEASGNTFWLVDPVDGTKEFIKKNGEFTVNVGLVYEGEPILGVVSIPAQSTIYYGVKNQGSFKQIGDKEPSPIKAEYAGKVPTIAASRSHLDQATEDFIKTLGRHKLVQSGSSIKICLVAEGKATLYPKLGETHMWLWDTAAADAVLRAAGGTILDENKNQPLTYDPAELAVPSFVAHAKNSQN